jgi:hypothetical protein
MHAAIPSWRPTCVEREHVRQVTTKTSDTQVNTPGGQTPGMREGGGKGALASASMEASLRLDVKGANNNSAGATNSVIYIF